MTPSTAAGRALLEAFTPTSVEEPDWAIRIAENGVVRHAIPHIEAEARAQAFDDVTRAVEALNVGWETSQSYDRMTRSGAFRDVLAAIERL